jgi:RNA polymerase sigma factor (sigma-70 family)
VNATLSTTAGGAGQLVTTQWALVVTAAEIDSPKAKAALGELYSIYCYPVYAFIRRRGYRREDAQDLTQDFFVHLWQKSTLSRADPQRGRFRNFLLGALDHFLAHAAERAQTQKRGGGYVLVSLDEEAAEARYQVAVLRGLSAHKIFEMRWASALIEAAIDRLRGEMEAEDKGRLFQGLQGYLVGDEEASYQQTAAALGLTLPTIKAAIHRLRIRYRVLLRAEIARTAATPDEVEEELRYLRASLRS